MSVGTETQQFATAADLKTAAEKQPESGFDSETGNLTVAGVVYRPQRYTREIRVAHTKLRREKVPVEKRTEASRITAKYETDANGKVIGVREPITDDEAKFMEEIGDINPDLAYYALPLLFKSAQGEPLSVELAMAELVDEEAEDAEEWVTANPTGRKTPKSSA